MILEMRRLGNMSLLGHLSRDLLGQFILDCPVTRQVLQLCCTQGQALNQTLPILLDLYRQELHQQVVNRPLQGLGEDERVREGQPTSRSDDAQEPHYLLSVAEWTSTIVGLDTVDGIHFLRRARNSATSQLQGTNLAAIPMNEPVRFPWYQVRLADFVRTWHRFQVADAGEGPARDAAYRA